MKKRVIANSIIAFISLMIIGLEAKSQANILSYTINVTSTNRCFPRLQWAMSYTNIVSIEIERAVNSTSFSNWVKIDNINLTVYNSSTPVGFSYIDENPFSTGAGNNSTFYYRLKIISATSQFWYSSNNSINNLNPNFTCTYGTGRCMNATIQGVNMNVCSSPQQLSINNLPFQSSPVTWSTSNNTIATVNSSGLVTPVSVGTVTISAFLPVCNVTISKTIEICSCGIPTSLGANSTGSAYALYFNLVGNINNYRLEWTNLSTNVNGSQDIVYSGSTYTFTGVPVGTTFRYRVSAITACGLAPASAWYYYGTTGTCSTTAPTGLSVACACGPSCAGSCGIERFFWSIVPNAVSYNVTYVITYNGNFVTQGSFNSTTVPANQPLINGVNNPPGSVISFSVTPVCSGGVLGQTATSGQFAL